MTSTSNKPSKTSQDMRMIDDCVKKIETSNSYWSDNKNKFRSNLDFVLGFQWENQGAAWRGRKRETKLTFNMLHSYAKSIMGEQLQNTPDIVVRAASRSVEQDEVNLIEGIIRGIFYDSKMPQLTYKVFFNQLAGAFGAFLVKPEYDSPMAFNQVCRISQKSDPTLCYWDHDSEDDNKITGKYCGFFTPIPTKEFEVEYSDIVAPQGFAWETLGIARSFYQKPFDYIVIAEHWQKVEENATIYLLDDGSTCTKDEYPKIVDKLEQDYLKSAFQASSNGTPTPQRPTPPKVLNERKSKIYKIKYYKMLRNRILEEREWPGTLLPLVYVDGDSQLRRGRQEVKSFFDFSHDSQRAFNYIKNEIIQQIKNFRREQWMGTPENVQGKGVQEMWRNPEEQTGILLAKRDENGQLPQKVPPSQISPDTVAMQQTLTGDMQNILGRHDASQGMEGNERAAAALLHRIVQDNMGSYIQLNNLCNGIVAVAQVCLDMIPSIYDSERDVVTRDKKGEPMVTTINEFAGISNDNGMYDAEKTYYKNQVSRKSMRIELSAGPMFSAQKQIEYNKLTQFAALMPQEFVPAIADMIAENIDLPNTNQLVKRAKAFVPLQILAQSGELTPEEKQQMEQQQQQQQNQPPSPEVQAQMQRNQIEMQKLQLQQQDLQDRAQNNQMQNYLTGLKTQVELEQVQNTKVSDQIGLQKDIIKANAELKSTAMQTMHQMHKINMDALSPKRQDHDGNNNGTAG